MKKIFSSLLLIGFLFSNQALRADDIQNLPPMGPPTGGLTIKKAEHPEWIKKFSQSKIVFCSPVITLTEDQANTADNPIEISLSSNPIVRISLQGNESNSSVYCSGGGSQHGFRWEYDNDGVDNDFLEMEACPLGLVHDTLHSPVGWSTKWQTHETLYTWEFLPKKTGTITLTFKKYYYSNAMVRNTDGSLPWKNPVETIQFTINVTDYNAIPDDGKIIPWQGGATVNQ